MSIRFRLLFLFTATLLLLAAIGVYSTLVYRDSFAIADQIRESTRRTVDAAREAQSFFRAEIAAWKDLVLREHEGEQYDLHLSTFVAAERDTHDSLQRLLDMSRDVPDVQESVAQLMGAYQTTGQTLRDARGAFNASEDGARASVEELAREAAISRSELFAAVVTLAQAHLKDRLGELDARRAAKGRGLLIATASVVVFSFALFLWLVDKHVGRPAQRAAYLAEVSDHAQRVAEFATWDWDSSRDDYYWSEGIYRIFGLAPQTKPSLGTLLEAVHPEDRKRVTDTIEAAKRQHRAYEVEYRVVPRSGAERVVQERGQASGNRKGPTRMTGIMYDITQRKRAEEHLAVLANFDTLTNLPNRYLFNDRLAHALDQAARSENRVALLFVDLDEFKAVNDAMGHGAGDDLLKQVAARLRQHLRDGDTLARLSGDEFAVIIENLRETNQLVHVVKHILAVLGRGFAVARRQLSVAASIGVSIFPDDAGDADTLLQNADFAMYKVKAQGGNGYQFFTEDLNRQAADRLDLERRLRLALDRQELQLVFLPQVELATGRFWGAEALLRWHPEQGSVAPGRFIPVLEDIGLIVPVGEWVLEQACRAARSWQDKGLGAVRVSVNLSAIQLRPTVDLISVLVRALAISGLESGSLHLEVKEGVLTDRYATQDLFHELRKLGVGLTVDDFGTGLSSLVHLKRLQVDALKIDRSLVRAISQDPEDAAVVAAIIALGQQLGIRVIAEGVERPEQLEFLRGRHCQQIQGFAIGEPMSAGELEAWIQELTPKPDGHYLDAVGSWSSGSLG